VDDAKDDKAILKIMKSTLPQFSNETDWELSIFELKLILARVWPHKDDMDIVEYMTSTRTFRNYTKDMEIRADNLIYYALTSSATKGSYAKLQIVAACHQARCSTLCISQRRKETLSNVSGTIYHDQPAPGKLADYQSRISCYYAKGA
jgi:hypothetical protein